jgi:hypothetical protein
VLGARHADFGADIARQAQIEGFEIIIDAGNSYTSLLEVLLQFEGIALD